MPIRTTTSFMFFILVGVLMLLLQLREMQIGTRTIYNKYKTFGNQFGNRNAEKEIPAKIVLQDEDRSFIKLMSKRMKERKIILRTACERLGLDKEKPAPIRVMLSQKYKLAYCFIPKAGSSNMKRIVMEFNGHFNLSTHDVHFLANKLYNKMRNGSLPQIVLEQNYTKFLIVRHPFERLVSAYNNKVAKTPIELFAKLSEKIRKLYGNATRAKESGKMASFEEFVDYLLDGHAVSFENSGDEHWLGYNTLCHPCTVDYDVIAHMETIEEDSRYLFQVIGAPRGTKYASGYTKSGESKTKKNNLVKEFMKLIKKEKLAKLYEAYNNDFELFGYNSNISNAT